MKKIIVSVVLAAGIVSVATAQTKAKAAISPEDYQFTTVKENPITSVKNQHRSGTCWCFSTLSFLESEIIKAKGIKDPAQYPDFSEKIGRASCRERVSVVV